MLRRLKGKEKARFIVVAEPWQDRDDSTILFRKGNKNKSINPIIIETASQPDNQNKLLLVPFLYGDHHPGIAIDLRRKQALYIDPFGTKPSYGKKKTKNLIKQLQTAKIIVSHIPIQQQQKITEEIMDRTSCGPILTASGAMLESCVRSELRN